MSTLARWAGLAAFCLFFGFLGSAAGLLTLPGHLRGEQGPPGMPGAAGPVRPAGPRGPEGTADIPANVAQLDNVVRNLETRQNELSAKLAALQLSTIGNEPGNGQCIPTPVVTDVEKGFSAAVPFTVQKRTVCLPLG